MQRGEYRAFLGKHQHGIESLGAAQCAIDSQVAASDVAVLRVDATVVAQGKLTLSRALSSAFRLPLLTMSSRAVTERVR